MHKKLQVANVENHPAKPVYGLISDAVSETQGWNVNLVEKLSDAEGRGMHLLMSDEVSNLIRDGRLPFTLERHLEGYFGESTGSANVTTVRLEEQMNITEVIELLSKTGQLDDALEIIEAFRQDGDPEAEVILTYALAQYAKGWLAEEYVTQQPWAETDGLETANKGSVSQDKGGIDFYYEGDMSQLGSITRYNSKKSEMEASDIRHLLYQWDAEGNIHVFDMKDALEVNKQIAKQDGMSATLIRRRADNLKVNEQLGRPIRYLWW